MDYKELASYADSVNICLSKGLCAPIGSLLLGRSDFIEIAKKNRKLMGGGMRQVGIIAAAGIIALKEMTERLSEDHSNAKYLAGKLSEVEGISVFEDRLDINMVFFKLSQDIISGEKLVEKLFERGFKINGSESDEYRFVTNKDISAVNIDNLVEAMREILATNI
jgi:threonine aldolase